MPTRTVVSDRRLLRRCLLWLAVSLSACTDSGTEPRIPEKTEPDHPVASVVIAPDTATLVLPGTGSQQLQATVRDRSGTEVTAATVNWTSSDTLVAAVSGTGLVTARRVGQAQVVAEFQGKSDTAKVAVKSTVGSLTLSADSLDLWTTTGARLAATLRDTLGAAIALPVTWRSSDPAVAAVDSAGNVTAERGGTAVITAESAGRSASAKLVVRGISFASVESGDAPFACGLGEDGKTYCWGDNSVSELGQGLTRPCYRDCPYVRTPVSVPAPVRFTTVDTRSAYVCALGEDGMPYCWGGSSPWTFGWESAPAANQCGIPPNPLYGCVGTPLRIEGSPALRSLYVGNGFNCGLTAEGEAYCWGSNNAGQLGDGTTASRGTPARVSSNGVRFRTLALGSVHACGIGTDGNTYCWGANLWGQLAIGRGDKELHPYPTRITGNPGLTSITARGEMTCGLTSAGAAYCWGRNEYGSLGTAAPMSTCEVGYAHAVFCGTSPLPVQGGHTFTSVRIGTHYACGLTGDGTAYCWGRNEYGELGVGGSIRSSDAPLPVAGGVKFASISPGYESTYARTSSGRMYRWGTFRFADETRLTPSRMVGSN